MSCSRPDRCRKVPAQPEDSEYTVMADPKRNGVRIAQQVAVHRALVAVQKGAAEGRTDNAA